MAQWSELLKYDNTIVSVVIPRNESIKQTYAQITQVDKEQFIEHVKQYLKTNDYYITCNNFPYDLELGISHWIFWFSETTYTLERAKLLCVELFETVDSKIIVFVNDINNKSIHEINHYHVLVKK
jgi:hypothetical protein